MNSLATDDTAMRLFLDTNYTLSVLPVGSSVIVNCSVEMSGGSVSSNMDYVAPYCNDNRPL